MAVGGGSVIDAAKVMRLLSEHPELTVAELALPFLDPRKRIARFPQEPHHARLIAVPTTAGTGSEVSPAAVLTVGGAKLTLVDYSLVPDMAIVDPRLTLTLPPEMTADTGVDALTHALEAYVSIFATPYTDAFCLQAIHLIFDALPRAFGDVSDEERLRHGRVLEQSASGARGSYSPVVSRVGQAILSISPSIVMSATILSSASSDVDCVR